MQPHPLNKAIVGARRKTLLIGGLCVHSRVCVRVAQTMLWLCVCDYADDGCICIIRVDLTVCMKMHVYEENQKAW